MDNSGFTIILADDHEIFLDSLSTLINSHPNLTVIAKVQNGKALVEKVKSLNADLCIVDMDMPVMSGLQASEMILDYNPAQKILILTMHKERSLIKKMMTLGIKGYLLKTCDKEEFVFAIQHILKGKTYFSDEVIETVVNESLKETSKSPDLAKISTLSSREIEIANLLCNGLSNKQIADQLFLSPKTVDNHRTNIMRKLEVHNIVGLIRFCLKHGLAE